ncbi:hypothetical protein LRAMOSA09040 [Lichtheimia ramosa]|uniref:Uncharacterized protein n=1 Tax=Lichtheimia ramosa TaxID=688394 RepID=A0A077WIU7_9FUNG|nr:hypothetical protein LRAMOSA09040 [Lichtheimia ramosa]
MKATFFLTLALIATAVSAGRITQVQQGGASGSDKSAKGGLAGIGLLNGDNTLLGSSKKSNTVNMVQNANN